MFNNKADSNLPYQSDDTDNLKTYSRLDQKICQAVCVLVIIDIREEVEKTRVSKRTYSRGSLTLSVCKNIL